MPGWMDNWLRRHRHPASLVLHAVAIPMLPVVAILIVLQLMDGAWNLWWRPAGLFLFSYLLQWIGHRIEGNDMGEVVLIKRWLGLPYVAIAPRFDKTPPSSPAARSEPTSGMTPSGASRGV